MTKYFTNNLSVINLYKEPSIKSEVVTQMNNNSGYFVTAGHDEGIFAFGETIEEASLQIDKLSKKYS